MSTSPASETSRADVFAALRDRLSGVPARRSVRLEATLSTTVEPLDELLGGGFPAGSLVALEGEGSSGKWSIAAALLAQATKRGLGAVIDEGELYPPSLASAHVRLDRLLIVRARSALGVARAADLLVRSRIVRVLVMPAVALRAAVWSRLANVAHRAGTLVVVMAQRAGMHLAGAAVIRVGCSLQAVLVNGSRGVASTFAGFDVRAELRKHKHGPGGAAAVVRAIAAVSEGAFLRESPLRCAAPARIAGAR